MFCFLASDGVMLQVRKNLTNRSLTMNAKSHETIKKSIQLTSEQDRKVAILYRKEMIRAMSAIGLNDSSKELSIADVDAEIPTQQKILSQIIEAGLETLLKS